MNQLQISKESRWGEEKRGDNGSEGEFSAGGPPQGTVMANAQRYIVRFFGKTK